MVSQKLRGYFHQVVWIQGEDLKYLDTPPPLTVNYRLMISVYKQLNSLNWNVDLAVLKTKIATSSEVTDEEFARVSSLLQEEAYKNKNPLTCDEDVIERMIEFLDRTQDRLNAHKAFLPYYKEAYAIWKDFNLIQFVDGDLKGELKLTYDH